MDSSRWSYPAPFYQPLQAYFATAEDWPGPRCGHSLTAVHVGNSYRLILFGGITTAANPSLPGGSLQVVSNSVHCFDLMTRRWTRVYPTGDAPSPRAGHVAASIASMVAIQGGIGISGPSDGDLYFLNMENNMFRWHRVVVKGEGPGPRYGHVMGLAAQRLVIFGGKVGNAVLDDTWGLEMDMPRNHYAWERLTPYGIVPSGRMYASAGTREDGIFVLSGGRDFSGMSLGDAYWLEMHNEGWWMWTPLLGQPHSERYQHTVAFVNTRMHIIGGVMRSGRINGETAFAVLNTLTGEWLDTNGQNLNQLMRRCRHAAASVGSCIYVHGGFREDVLLDDFLFADDDASQPSTSEPTIPSVMWSDISSSGNAMERLAETSINLPTVEDAFYSSEVERHAQFWQRSVISTLLRPEDWKPPANREFFLNYFDIAELCNAAEKIIVQQPVMLHLKAPMKVFGDLHGQFGDLMRMFHEFGSPSRKGDIAYIDYLFLGDYVDRGKHSLETILLLLALKIEYPKNLHLIRGNHESSEVNNVFGFLKECTERMGHSPGTQTWAKINRLFNNLPLAALIEKKILCVHGGLGLSVHSVEQVRNIQRPILPKDITFLVKDLLWSDPTANDSVLGMQKNQRGPLVFSFGPDVVKSFCERNNLEMILRAHECVLDGFERFAEGKLITVFSATNYCGTAKNAGAILVIGRDMVIYPKLIHPLPPPISPSENPLVETWQMELTDERPPTPVRGRSEPGGSAAKAERFVNEQLQRKHY